MNPIEQLKKEINSKQVIRSSAFITMLKEVLYNKDLKLDSDCTDYFKVCNLENGDIDLVFEKGGTKMYHKDIKDKYITVESTVVPSYRVMLDSTYEDRFLKLGSTCYTDMLSDFLHSLKVNFDSIRMHSNFYVSFEKDKGYIKEICPRMHNDFNIVSTRYTLIVLSLLMKYSSFHNIRIKERGVPEIYIIELDSIGTFSDIIFLDVEHETIRFSTEHNLDNIYNGDYLNGYDKKGYLNKYDLLEYITTIVQIIKKLPYVNTELVYELIENYQCGYTEMVISEIANYKKDLVCFPLI